MRADEVVEDRLARVLVQHGGGHERRRQRARHRLCLLVDEEDAVGVPVEGQTDVGAALEDRLLQRDQVLGLDRVGRVVGERAVELGEEDLDREGQALEDDRHDQPAHAVGGVGDHLEGPQRGHVDEGDHVVGPLVEQVRARARPPVSGGTGSPSSSSASASISARPVSRADRLARRTGTA